MGEFVLRVVVVLGEQLDRGDGIFGLRFTMKKIWEGGRENKGNGVCGFPFLARGWRFLFWQGVGMGTCCLFRQQIGMGGTERGGVGLMV